MTDTPPPAALEAGTYEVVRKRLDTLASSLLQEVDGLNQRRLTVFGASNTTLLATEHLRTNNNCIPRDVVTLGDRLILGYQVHMGLKSSTNIDDVFTEVVFRDGQFHAVEQPSFTGDGFNKDFAEIFHYYKDARLLQLRKTDTHLLAAFQTGQRLSDVRVLRWGLSTDRRTATYIDNRGVADYTLPPSHDFTWVRTTRDDHVQGAHPHINIVDTVFVESIHGDVTIKIENNTSSGQGILSDPVDDSHQGIDDAEVSYADLDTIILLKIRPYRENDFRYYAYNKITHEAVRIDALGQSCQQLPEGHGLIFPGGYYLASGEHKVFPHDVADMQFIRSVRAPNGEDILYIYYEREHGNYVLLRYNLITRSVDQPQLCNGYSFFPDGRLVMFRAQEEPSRLHAMQLWQTPFCEDDHAEAAPSRETPLGRIGNRDLVRGISDLRNLNRLLANQSPTREAYAELLKQVTRISDSYHWLSTPDAGQIQALLAQIKDGINAAIGEFEKVLQLTAQAAHHVAALTSAIADVLRTQALDAKETIDDFVQPLAEIRAQRGAVESARELRYVDASKLDALAEQLVAAGGELSGNAVTFLLQPESLDTYVAEISDIETAIPTIATVADAKPVRERVDALAGNLDLLVETVGTLEIADATARTAILERISSVYATLNRVRALLEARRSELGTKEGQAGFTAELALLAQAVGNAISLSTSPEKCDEFLGKLMLQVEELESRFAEVDRFVTELAGKREEIYESFSARKQSLLDARQRRADALANAADRVLSGIVRRAKTFTTNDELNAYFASDPMVLKARSVIEELRTLGATVRADDTEGRIKAAREDGLRALRDRSELYDGEAVKLGRHRFSVNTQAIDLTMLPRRDADGVLGMWFHITGTDYFSPVEDPAFTATQDCWDRDVISESPNVYRGEYLAWQVLTACERHEHGLDPNALRRALLDEAELSDVIRSLCAVFYDHGYERGIHDHDAAKILAAIMHLRETCGLLRFTPQVRASGLLAWSLLAKDSRAKSWERQARALNLVAQEHGPSSARQALAAELATAITALESSHGLVVSDAANAARYLVADLGNEPRNHFVCSGEADQVLQAVNKHLAVVGVQDEVNDDLRALRSEPQAAWRLAGAWVDIALRKHEDLPPGCRDEVAAWLALGDSLSSEVVHARTHMTLEGLLGQHPRISNQSMVLALDDAEARLTHFAAADVPRFRHFQQRRQILLDRERATLRVDEFKPRVLTSFVRNRLINEVYLPLIGDNLAKQMGALGATRRTDLMGMLLLISPPGYGKTTLIEYVASVLGLAFIKVNGPALGHAVTSTDPAAAPNAAARQELEKLNLAFEMGNNVLIMLDDIQHTDPELLQKFISLCDGSRRIEGVWRGRARTYDLRGKKVVIVMAGNPYTESGEQFRIPDMLANRADTYNLGDILGGHADNFALSYIENALTANPVLSTMTGRPQKDLYALIRVAQGDDSARDGLEHPYSALEIGDLTAVLNHLQAVQRILGQVNATYIASAATANEYRTEPPFKLQGSYRNMAKIAAKIVPMMTDTERNQVILDHYAGESQTLTTGAESNLLKFKALFGVQTDDERKRWQDICSIYTRRQELDGADDPASKAVVQLAKLGDQLASVRDAVHAAATQASANNSEQQRVHGEQLNAVLDRLATALSARDRQADERPKVEIINTLPKYYGTLYAQQIQVIEQTLVPTLDALGKVLGHHITARDHLGAIADDLRNMIRKQASSEVIDPHQDNG